MADHDVAIFRDGRLAVPGLGGSVHDYLYDRVRGTSGEPGPILPWTPELFQSHRYE